jgi:hypothetical protein
MMSFWKNIGKGFAYIGKGAIKAAVWSSQHPEVLGILKVAIPNSTAQVVIQDVSTGLNVAGAVASGH